MRVNTYGTVPSLPTPFCLIAPGSDITAYVVHVGTSEYNCVHVGLLTRIVGLLLEACELLRIVAVL